MLLFVGLGNPTPDSENNRHNVGFKIIDSIEDPNYEKEERMNHLLLSGKFQRSYSKVREYWKKYGW